jgi:hypothetical protein
LAVEGHNAEITQKELKRKLCLGFEVFTAVAMKNAVFWDVAPCDGLVTSYVSEECVASIFREEEITRAKKSVRRLLRD